MKLTLGHTQRLNLRALLSAQRAVCSVGAIWAIQGHIALDADMERSVGLIREAVAGQECVSWKFHALGRRKKLPVQRPGGRTFGDHIPCLAKPIVLPVPARIAASARSGVAPPHKVVAPGPK